MGDEAYAPCNTAAMQNGCCNCRSCALWHSHRPRWPRRVPALAQPCPSFHLVLPLSPGRHPSPLNSPLSYICVLCYAASIEWLVSFSLKGAAWADLQITRVPALAQSCRSLRLVLPLSSKLTSVLRTHPCPPSVRACSAASIGWLVSFSLKGAAWANLPIIKGPQTKGESGKGGSVNSRL